MTKEQLQERINLLEREKVAALATYEGAIQDCKFWLSQPEAPQETTEGN